MQLGSARWSGNDFRMVVWDDIPKKACRFESRSDAIGKIPGTPMVHVSSEGTRITLIFRGLRNDNPYETTDVDALAAVIFAAVAAA